MFVLMESPPTKPPGKGEVGWRSSGRSPSLPSCVADSISTMPKQSQRTVTVPFHSIAMVALAGGAASGPVRPDQFGTSLASVSDGYELFRVPSLRFRVFSSAAAALAAGVVTSVPNTVPATLPTIGELLDSVQHQGSGVETQWSRWINVRKDTLSGPFGWYHTRLGTFDPTEAAPATLCYAGTGTNTFYSEVMGVMQFKDPAATADTPAAVALRSAIRKDRFEQDELRLRQRVLQVLQATPGGAPPSPMKSV